MSEREIITLQLGNYSNHVATHWWNLHQNSTHRKDHNSSKNDSLGWESTSSSNSNNDSVSQISKTVLWRVVGGVGRKILSLSLIFWPILGHFSVEIIWVNSLFLL